MTVEEFDIALTDLETRVDRLRALYENWFRGYEKTEPAVPRKDVERRVYGLRKELPRNTALRFRYHQLYLKYTTLANYWQRTARQIEEGTYRPQLQRLKRKLDREQQEQERRDRRRTERGDEAPADGPRGYELDLDESLNVDDLLDDLEMEEVARALDRPGPHSEPPPPTKVHPRPATPTAGSAAVATFSKNKGTAQSPVAGKPVAQVGERPGVEAPAQSAPDTGTGTRPALPGLPRAPQITAPPAAPRPVAAPSAGGFPAPGTGSVPGLRTQPGVAPTPGASQATPSAPAMGTQGLPPPRPAAPPAGRPVPTAPGVAAPKAAPSPPAAAGAPGTPARPAPAAAPRPAPAAPANAGPAAAPRPAPGAAASAPSPAGAPIPGRAAPPVPAAPPGVARPAPAPAPITPGGRPAAAPTAPAGTTIGRPAPVVPQAPAAASGTTIGRPAPAAPAASRAPVQGGGTFVGRPPTASPLPDAGAPDEQRMKRIYDEYTAARKRNNEGEVRYEALVGSIQKMLPELAKKHQGKRIDFEVVVKDGRVGLKPKAT